MGKTKKQMTKWSMKQKVDANIKKKNINKELTSNIYIPNLQAKDIFLAEKCNNEICLINKNNEINTYKYKGTIDYSKEQVKLREVYNEIVNKKDVPLTKKLYNVNDELIKVFSDAIMCLSFDYAVKEWNTYSHYDNSGKRYSCYVAYGTDYRSCVFNDCIAKNENGEIVGVIVGKEYKNLDKDIEKYPFFKQAKIEHKKSGKEENVYETTDKGNKTKYYDKTLIDEDGEKKYLKLTTNNIRKILYLNGFDYNGVHYRRYKRASGSARKGKCLFIKEELYQDIATWSMMGININMTDEVDLAGLEAYIGLTLSGCETREIIHINKEQILFVDEVKSVFNTNCIAIEENEDHHLQAQNKNVEITNNLVDGEALIEASEIKSGYGMALLRERMFKACAFATNLQKWFSDNGIKDISQLNGFTLAKDIKDIKLVINKSCVKYCKFGKYKDWLNQIDGDFYVVKHEHKSAFYNEMVSAHYQLLNTLQLTKEETRQLIKPNFDYMNLVNTDVNVFKYHLKNHFLDDDFIISLLDLNPDNQDIENIHNTRKDAMKKFRTQAKQGHFLIHGNYSVLFGNPISYLMQTIKPQYIKKQLHEFEGAVCMSKKFKDGEKLVVCRSPHVFVGNLALLTNVHNNDISRYFRLTENIICLNAINENIMERLSSCDFDSDQSLITNEPIIVNAVEKNYNKFGVPTSLVAPTGKNTYHYNNMYDLARLDNITFKNSSAIGEIINFSQVLQSLMWDKINHDINDESVQCIINDCALLDVMSCLCIDSAKKNYSQFDLNKELDIIRSRYKDELTFPVIHDGKPVSDEKGEQVYAKVIPTFFEKIDKLKGYKKPKDKYHKFDTTMCYLIEIINAYKAKKRNHIEKSLYKTLLENVGIKMDKDKVYKDQIKDIIENAEKLQKVNTRLASSTDKGEDSSEEIKKERIVFYTYVASLKTNVYTAYAIIKMLDKEEYSQIKRYVIFGLMLNDIWHEIYGDVLETRLERSIYDDEVDYRIFDINFSLVLSKNSPK